MRADDGYVLVLAQPLNCQLFCKRISRSSTITRPLKLRAAGKYVTWADGDLWKDTRIIVFHNLLFRLCSSEQDLWGAHHEYYNSPVLQNWILCSPFPSKFGVTPVYFMTISFQNRQTQLIRQTCRKRLPYCISTGSVCMRPNIFRRWLPGFVGVLCITSFL